MFDKKKKSMSPIEKDAKMSVIEAMRKMAEEAMGDKLKGLKKVTVASNSKEGLEEGLEKAKSILDPREENPGREEMEEALSEELDGDDEMDESHDHQEKTLGYSPEGSDSDEEMSEEEINEKLQQLMRLKDKMKMKS